MAVKSPSDVAAHIRTFMQIYQFRSDPYRLYYLCIPTGHEGSEQFHQATEQKYLLRQIKAIDSLITGDNIQGAATIVNVPGTQKWLPTQINPVLLTLYGHRLAAGGSFKPAQSTCPGRGRQLT